MRFFIAVILTGVPVFAQIYVSPAGNDRNPGDSQRPVATIRRAQELVRTRNGAMAADLIVYLAGGTYRLTQPLVFEERDSGMNGHDVVFQAQTGQTPIISGGVRVTGWKLVDEKRNLWSAPAPSGLQNTRQLYVDGVRAYRAHGRVPVKLTQTETGYTAASPLMATWRNPTGIEFVYTGGNAIWSEPTVGLGSWTEPRCPIASIRDTEIVMAQPCWDNSTKRVMLPSGTRTANLVGPKSVGHEPAFVENAFELLGRPGEWYLDRTPRKLYYVPRSENLTTSDVEVPVLEKLVNGLGTTEHPVHNIVFSGIQFSFATWLEPSTTEGFSEIQANYRVTGASGYSRQALCDLVPGGTCPYGNWSKEPGNVEFAGTRNVRFLNDAFVHLGAAGLDLGNGSQSDVVEGCVFTDISGNGMELGGVDNPLAPIENYTSENRISNNHIYAIGAEFHGGIGIVVGYARNTHVEHNELDHLPYAAISMGWGGWPDKIKRAGQANNSANNVVAHNLIHDFMLLLSDGGGIYTQGLTGKDMADGEKVTGNVIRDQFSTGHGIYSDNGSCNMTIAGNLIFNTNFDNWGSRHKDYYDGADGKSNDPLIVKDNYWQQGDADSTRDGVEVSGNRVIARIDQAPAQIIGDAGIEKRYQAILGKRFSHNAAPEPPSRVAAAASGDSAFVTWNPPPFTGDFPIDSYTVSASKGESVTISAAEFAARSYVELKGLNKTGEYAFTVTANNGKLNSEASLASLPLSMSNAERSLPSAPAEARALPGDGTASIHFRAPEQPHHAPILAYRVTINPGGREVVFQGRRVLVLEGRHTTFDVVDGLEKGETYTFSVAAVTSAGSSAAVTTAPVRIP